MELAILMFLAIGSLGLGAGWLASRGTQQRRARHSHQAGRGESLAEIEQAVSALIDRLTATADDCLARLQAEQRRIESLLGEAPSPPPQESAEAEPAATPAAAHPAVAAYLDAGAAGVDAVYRLADQRLDEAAIARETGISRDEVQLMLALRAARS